VDKVLDALAKKYAVTPGEICLRWCIDQDVVAITTSAKEQRLSDYLRAMTFKLTPKEVQDVSRSARRANVIDCGLLIEFRSMKRAARSTTEASGLTSMTKKITGSATRRILLRCWGTACRDYSLPQH